MTELTPSAVRAHMTSATPEWLDWQSRVPDTLDACRRRWDLEIGDVLAERISSRLHRVRLRGRAAVLKLTRPGPHLTQQANVLEAARGRGYVHLYERDDQAGALLLEELGESEELRADARFADLPAEAVLRAMQDGALLEPVVATLHEAWQVPLEVAPEPTAATHKAAQLASMIDRLADELDVRGTHGAAIDRALTYAGQRLSVSDVTTPVLCHGDPHLGNLLAVTSPRPGATAGYVYVDPDGFRCEPEYDLGVVLRGFNRVVLAAEDPVVEVRGWCAALAAPTDTDAEAIWQWALIERVGAGLYLMDHGWRDRGRHFLDAATWLIARKGRA